MRGNSCPDIPTSQVVHNQKDFALPVLRNDIRFPRVFVPLLYCPKLGGALCANNFSVRLSTTVPPPPSV